jgi:hypothetical protein
MSEFDETRRDEAAGDGGDAGVEETQDTGVDGTEDTGGTPGAEDADGEGSDVSSAAEAAVEGETPEEAEAKEAAGIATAEQNAALEHSEGGATTRDGTDAGVPMQQGSPDEPVGPEDAFGEGEKRGDYSTRVGTGAHAVSVPVEGGGEPILDDDGNQVDVRPKSKLVDQVSRVAEQGDVAGEKGGVTTDA